MLHPVESYGAIRAHHLAPMAEERKRILVLRWHGLTDEEIAEQEGLSESSIKRHLEMALASIFDALDVKRGAWAAGPWISCHQVCCLAAAISYVRGDAP